MGDEPDRQIGPVHPGPRNLQSGLWSGQARPTGYKVTRAKPSTQARPHPADDEASEHRQPAEDVVVDVSRKRASIALACITAPLTNLAAYRGRGPKGPGPARRRTLGRAKAGLAQFSDLAVSRATARAPLRDHRGRLGGRRPARGAGRQRLVRPSRWSRRCRPCRCARTDLQRIADRRRQIALPPAAERSGSSQAGPRRGGDRRAERRGDREPSQGHALRRDGRRRGPGHDRRARGAARQQRKALRRASLQRCGRQWTGRPLRRPPPIPCGKIQDPIRATFPLRSRAATGTMSCARDPKRQEHAHDPARCDRSFFRR